MIERLYNFLKDAFLKPFRHRAVLLAITVSDLKGKYAGSILGMLWLLLFPLLFLSMYAVVYMFIFRVRLKVLSPWEYVLLIFSGLIPFLSFSEALSRGTQAVTANPNLIHNTLFPIELLPIQITLSTQVTQVIGFIMLLIALVVQGKLSLTVIFLPILWLAQLAFTTGLLWLTSSINVFFRDLSNMIPLITLFLMMISPIAYTPDMIPKKLKLILLLNPLYYMITSYQDLLIFGRLELRRFCLFIGLALCVYFTGYYVFIKLKDVFGDYV